MMGINAFNIRPSTGALLQVKLRLAEATKGHKLLKTKLEALKREQGRLARQIVELRSAVTPALATAWISLAEAKFATRSLNQIILHNINTAQLKVKYRMENTSGVTFPLFEAVEEGEDNYSLVGLSSGGRQISRAKTCHKDALLLLVDLVSFQAAFVALSNEIQRLSRRVNAIERIIIPKHRDLLKYLEGELDDLQREDAFRLRKMRKPFLMAK